MGGFGRLLSSNLLEAELRASRVYEQVWLSDSERVLYWDTKLYSVAIWNARTGDRVRLPGIAGPGSPAMSRDYRTIYFLEQRSDGDVWMLTLQGEP